MSGTVLTGVRPQRGRLGCAGVTETRTDWHEAGDFDAAVPKPERLATSDEIYEEEVAPSPAVIPNLSPDKSCQVSEPPVSELSFIGQARRDHVASLLEKVGQEELRVLTHLALHGSTDISAINRMGSVPINNLLVVDLVKHIPAPPGAPSFQQFYEINQGLSDAIIFHLNMRGLL